MPMEQWASIVICDMPMVLGQWASQLYIGGGCIWVTHLTQSKCSIQINDGTILLKVSRFRFTFFPPQTHDL